ncbi:MAG: oligosaccharide flippase family protein [Chthoniobacterales bacterium]|nr:oligosaccharide flippase family protein [Chthoniobacterales bacterium]
MIQVGARIGILLLGVVLMGYLARRLGTAEYGRYAVAVVLINWLMITIVVATGGATIRLVAGQKNGRRYAVSMLQMAGMLATTLAVVIALAAQPLADLLRSPGIAPLLRILSADFALSTVAGIYVSILVAQGRYVLSAGISLATMATRVLAAFIFVEQGLLASGACLALVAGAVVQLVMGRWASGIAFFSRDRVPFADLWGHTRLLAGAQLALHISQSMDLLAVKFFALSPAIAGLYAGGQNIGQAGFMLFGPTQAVLLQSMAKSRREENHLDAARTGALYLRVALTYSTLLCALSVLADEIAVFLLGPAFAQSGTILAILLWAVAFRLLAGTGRTLIAAVGEKVSIMLPLLILIVLGIIAYAIAIPRGGIIAAAAVALGLAVAGGLTSLREGLKLMGIRFPWISLLKIAVAAAVTALVAASLPGSGWLLIAKLAVSCLLYAALLFSFNEWRPTRQQLMSLRQALAR